MPPLVVKNANLPGIEPRSSARNLTITLMVHTKTIWRTHTGNRALL